jgi:hypothetical protein
MKKVIFVLLFILSFSINTLAQKTSKDVVYTPGVPSACILGKIYINVATGAVYTFKTAVGCNPIGSGTFTGQLLGPDGTGLAPTYSFANSPATGIYSTTTNRLAMSVNNSLQFLLYGTQLDVPATLFIGMGENLSLANDGANVLSLRNTTNAQRLNIANTYTSGANREDLSFYFNANIGHIGTTTTGATARVLQIDYGGTTTAAISIPITSGNITFGGPITVSSCTGCSLSATNGQSVLSADFDVTGTAFVDTGLSVTLPAAGTYIVSATVASTYNASANFPQLIFKLFNSTDATDVANSQVRTYDEVTGVYFGRTTKFDNIITIAASKTIKLYASRGAVATYTLSRIHSTATEGYTRLNYVRLS